MNRYGVNVDEGAEIGVAFELRVHNRQATVTDLDFILYLSSGEVVVEEPMGSAGAQLGSGDDWLVSENHPATVYPKEVTPESPFLTRFTVKTQRPIVGVAVYANLMDGEELDTGRKEVPVDEWPEEKLQDDGGSQSPTWFSWLKLG